MAFKDETWSKKATQGAVSMVAIKAAIAFDHISESLQGLSEGRDISENIATVKRISRELEKVFDDLSGWYEDDE